MHFVYTTETGTYLKKLQKKVAQKWKTIKGVKRMTHFFCWLYKKKCCLGNHPFTDNNKIFGKNFLAEENCYCQFSFGSNRIVLINFFYYQKFVDLKIFTTKILMDLIFFFARFSKPRDWTPLFFGPIFFRNCF